MLGEVHVWVCVSQKCDIARHVITEWMFHRGRIHAGHEVSAIQLDLENTAAALLHLERDPSVMSSLMITDSTPNTSGVRD